MRTIHLTEQEWQGALRLVRERCMFADNAADWEPLLDVLEVDRPLCSVRAPSLAAAVRTLTPPVGTLRWVEDTREKPGNDDNSFGL